VDTANHHLLVQTRRLRRQRRIRKRLSGTPERPRLAVFRSSKHIYAQIIDDLGGRTLAQASTVDAEVKAEVKYGGSSPAAPSRRASRRSASTAAATSTTAASRPWRPPPARAGSSSNPT